ncbi:carnitine O-palmitoyltransferase 1, liver isoform-like isoform X2 [Phymastichus coffea]|nr:carnitine O-palmitoyltransferase 1, liver isoform-like isoform X2 [Phymastichus coffea]
MWQKPQLYSFQGLLPRLPLPSVDVTIEKYLRSMRPLLDDKEYNRLSMLSRDFQRQPSTKLLQRYLHLKSWTSPNYVSDWWKKYAYLSCRSPLMINSNVYAIDLIMMDPSKIQSARAAYLTYAYLHCRELIASQQLRPIVIQGIIPLCSLQYQLFYNTTRVPGIEVDEVVHFGDEFHHMVAYHRGKYYEFPIYHDGRLLRPCDLERQIQWILNDGSESCAGEEKLAALTAGNRTDWARARREFFGSGANRESLRIIETAAFVLILDDIAYEYDKDDPEKLNKFSAAGLHGKGYDRWFDKSFNLCVSTNGKAIIHAEHSWADGAVTASISEYVLSMDVIEKPYKANGHTKGTADRTVPLPTRLSWDLSRQCVQVIDRSALLAEEMIASVDLYAYLHYDYGKGLMKRVKVSPDAYVQMALQLAYYRDTGKLAMTYEASITRLYRAGRTETIRPCTMEMAAWVKAMDDPNATTAEKLELMTATAIRHRINSQDAMCGQGVDRHLFALFVVSKYLQVDSPFLKEVFSKPWNLSTSQIPLQQYFKIDLKKEPRFIIGGAGFGPVDEDGYGVCYAFGGEDLLIFHISSKHTSPETNSKRFANNIRSALTDMRNMVTQKAYEMMRNPHND